MPALPWLLPAFVAGLATIHLAQRWTGIVTMLLRSTVATLTLLLFLVMIDRRSATMTASEVDTIHAVLALLH